MNVRHTVLPAIVCAIAAALSAQPTGITIVLTGQSMIRSDLRTTKPAAVHVIKALLPGAPANTPNTEDARRILQSIRDARQRADVVIVYQHNHVFGNRSFSTIFTEGLPERLAPNPWLTKWTHDEIDAGADIVVMHGAPLLHGVEIYRGRPIFYDLGNFIYNVPPTLTYIDEPMAWESVVASVQFDAGSQTSSQRPVPTFLKSITFRPVVLNNIGDGQPDVHNPHASNEFLHTRGLPAPATGARAGYILERLSNASKPFGTTMEIKGETATVTVISSARR